MRKILLAAMACGLAAAPSKATTINFTNEGTIVGGDTFGNSLTHTEDGVIVNVTGWSANNGTVFFDASKVRVFSTGLGTCASTEKTSEKCKSPQHAIDNSGRKEVLLVTFSTPVDLTEAIISAWADDFDATFWGGTGSVNMTASSFTSLDGLVGLTAYKGHDEFTGNASNGQLRTVSLGAVESAVSWLVFGAPLDDKDDKSKDHFKFKKLTFSLPPPPPPPPPSVPEPGTVALIGIGVLLATRKKR